MVGIVAPIVITLVSLRFGLFENREVIVHGHEVDVVHAEIFQVIEAHRRTLNGYRLRHSTKGARRGLRLQLVGKVLYVKLVDHGMFFFLHVILGEIAFDAVEGVAPPAVQRKGLGVGVHEFFFAVAEIVVDGEALHGNLGVKGVFVLFHGDADAVHGKFVVVKVEGHGFFFRGVDVKFVAHARGFFFFFSEAPQVAEKIHIFYH